jgi:intracellular multiplication protein IcmV
MKKKQPSAIVRTFNRIINVRGWFDYERIRAFTLYLFNGLKSLFVPQPKAASESFETVMKRMQLTEQDLILKQRALRRLSIIMVCIASIVEIYALYLLINAYFPAALLTIVVGLLALVFAFRYHFWYFQIKQRKLGCTLLEWYEQGLRGKSS